MFLLDLGKLFKGTLKCLNTDYFTDLRAHPEVYKTLIHRTNQCQCICTFSRKTALGLPCHTVKLRVLALGTVTSERLIPSFMTNYLSLQLSTKQT